MRREEKTRGKASEGGEYDTTDGSRGNRDHFRGHDIHHVAPSSSIYIFHMSLSPPRRASHTSSADDNGGSKISPSSHATDTCDNTGDED